MKYLFLFIPLSFVVVCASAQNLISVQVASVRKASQDQRVQARATPQGTGRWRILVPAHIRSRFKVGSPIQVQSLVYANQIRTGVVESFKGEAVIVRVKVTSQAEMWQPFSFSYVEPAQDVKEVPTLSVFSSNGLSASVFLVGKDLNLKRTLVEVIGFRGGMLLVRGELKDGDLIVSRGLHRVREGVKVNPIKVSEEAM
jgi:hypothetical protein